jgi:hypothetical protein
MSSTLPLIGTCPSSVALPLPLPLAPMSRSAALRRRALVSVRKKTRYDGENLH